MADSGKGAFHARMEVAEPGLYRALYRGVANANNPEAVLTEGPQVLPDTHIGTDAPGLKMWVEQLASGLGYDRVEWESLPPEAG